MQQILPRTGITAVVMVACTTSPNDKPLIPSDHTDSQGGAFHKSGYETPFETDSECASSTCHHADLRGGWALVEEDDESSQHYAPSCYQCHGVKWDDTRPNDVQVLYPTADVVWRHGQRRVVEHWAPGASSETIELLSGEAVVATLAENAPVAEVFRVLEIDPDWGTGTDFRIRVTTGSGGVGTGDAFTICESDAVLVTRPLMGAVFSVGDEIAVEWMCAAGVAVDLDVSRLGSQVGVFRDGAGNTGFHRRVVPADWGTGTGFQIRIFDFEGRVGMSPPFEIVK